jgi:uncharacterized protein
MKLNLKSLRIHPMESQEFHIQEQGRDSFLADIGGRYLKPVRVDLIVENTGRMLVAKGKVSTIIGLSCGRCLEEYEYPVDMELSFIVSDSLNNSDNDEEVIILKDNQADITPVVEEAVFSSIPLSTICNEQCKGLCPVCGINRNLHSCKCEQNNIDPRWEKLKEWK